MGGDRRFVDENEWEDGRIVPRYDAAPPIPADPLAPDELEQEPEQVERDIEAEETKRFDPMQFQ